ncbi:hypothetical protein BGZ98_009001 [Dissophora globulifera]|nr:hypothetical protein BGZ98_009001 [Dissophora globulifera]
MTLHSLSMALLLLATPFLAAPVVSQSQGPIAQEDCVKNYDPNTDYFPSKIEVDHATLFTVHYEKNYKVVSNVAPGVNQTYVLTQCGTPPPDSSLFNASNTVFITIPVDNAAVVTTTSIAFIEMLGERSAIKAVDTEALVSSPCVQYDLEHNKTVAIDDRNATLRTDQLEDVDVIFSGLEVEPGLENKTVITSEVLDPGPLNRAEWLEFYATFFNQEQYAQNLTATINNNYNCFKDAATSQPTKPVIAWTSYDAPAEYNNNTASWTISDAEYKRILSENAGATFYNGTTNNTFTDNAEFLESIKDVDVIIDETMILGSSESDMQAFLNNYNLTSANKDDYKFLKNEAVFREDGLVNPNDGRDWFSGAVVMADAVLQDVIRAVHPNVLPASVHYNWIRNIAKDEPPQLLTSANCTSTDADKPIPDRAIQCSTMNTTGHDSQSLEVNVGSLTIASAWTAVLVVFTAAMTV